MSWSLSCLDWQDRIRNKGRSLVAEFPLDEVAANRAVSIFDKLRLPDVAGMPLLADAAGDWFRDIVRALHGSIDRKTGNRNIREVFLLVPKKNSKTTNGAALMLTSLLINKRPNAEFLLIAPTQPITEIAFNQVAGMIEADPKLNDPKRIHIQFHLKKITYLPTGATLQVKSFDPNVLTSVKPAGVLVDELHVVSGNANADRVIGQLRGGLISQNEGFLVFITTQSERPPAGVFKSELDKARAIRDGKREGAMLPVLYEFPDDIRTNQDKWGDSTNWWMITPNDGRSISISRLEQEYQTAKDTGDAEFRRWASQHLNIEIGLGLHTDAWAGAEFWEDAGDRKISLDEMLLRCDVIVCGIDGGGLDDLLGFAAIGRDRDTRKWLHYAKAWAHKSVLERRKEIAPKIADLVAAGDMVVVDNLGEDIEQLVDIIDQIEVAGLLPELNAIGVDPVGIGQVIDALAERGIDNTLKQRIVGVSQGWKLSGAIKTTERKLAEGSLTHGAQPLMAWAIGNAKVEPKGNAITITKQTSGSAKIDPLMATFNAVALMALNPDAGMSVFDKMSEPEAEIEARSDAESPQIDEDVTAILGNPAHPRWKEVRDNFEAGLSADEDF